jgi:hypothetical protein
VLVIDRALRSGSAPKTDSAAIHFCNVCRAERRFLTIADDDAAEPALERLRLRGIRARCLQHLARPSYDRERFKGFVPRTLTAKQIADSRYATRRCGASYMPF